MLILQKHLTFVTTINTRGEEKAIDRSVWLLFLRCFSGSLSEGRLSSRRRQAAADPRGCLQSSTWGVRGEQDDRELNTALKWHWLPARIRNGSLRADGCWEELILASSLCHPQARGAPLWGGSRPRLPEGGLRQFWGTNISSAQADGKAELALNLQWCKVFVFDKITGKTSYPQVLLGNTAICSLHRHWSTSLTHSLRSQKNCCNTELLQNTMNITMWYFHIY